MRKILLSLLLGLGISLSAQTVYITNTGEKYHTSGCRYLKKSKIEKSLKDAIGQGYQACKVCHPPQTVREETEKKEIEKAPVKSRTSSQCTATTKAGNRCKRMTTSANGKCWQHG